MSMDRLLIWIGWKFGLIHVPEWDNVQPPWPSSKPVQPVATSDKPQTRTLEYGRAEPGQRPNMQEFLEKEVGDLEWEMIRWDGKGGSLDFTTWSIYDDQIINEKGFSDKTRQNYIAVRSQVLQGLTNSEIAREHGKKLRWAETYAGAVRAMCMLRKKSEKQELCLD